MSRIQPLFSVLLYQPFRWCYDNSPTRYRCLPKSKSVWYAVQQIANVKICWTICKFSIKYIPKFNAHSKKEIQVSLFFNLPWSLHTDQLFTEQFPLQGHSAQFPAPVDLCQRLPTDDVIEGTNLYLSENETILQKSLHLITQVLSSCLYSKHPWGLRAL